MRSLSLFALLFITGTVAAQNTDSLKVVKTFNELLSICKNVNFGDLKVTQLGTFYNAAPYIVYRGKDEKRSWKDVANYSNEEEKKGVNEVCYKINNTVNKDTAFKVTKYFTQIESEGKWHILLVSYVAKGKNKHAAFAFLKIKNRFALGDID